MNRPYTIYYVNLSLFNSRAVNFIPLMHEIESGKKPASDYAECSKRAIGGKGNPVLNEYMLDPADCGGIFEGKKEVLHLYGLQTNECPLKAVLQVTDIDELVIVASEGVYENSVAIYNKAAGKCCDRTNEEKDFRISEKLDSLKFKDFLHLENINQYTLPDDTADGTEDSSRWTNTLDYFIMEIRYYLREVIKVDNDHPVARKGIRTISIFPIKNDVERDGMTNCSINVAKRALDQANRGLNLIIDTNGGKRDMSMIQIAIIRALKARGLEAKNVLYSNFNNKSIKWTIQQEPFCEGSNRSGLQPGNSSGRDDGPVKIQDRSSEYDIFNVVSGIDEFISYGRVERLQNYFNKSTSGIMDVLNSVDRMCKSFMTCFTDDMINSVMDVRDKIYALSSTGKPVSSSSRQTAEQNELEKYVIEQIMKDLDDVLTAAGKGGNSGKASAIFPLIEWCRNKKYYQQAITLYVDRIDTWYYEKGILNGVNTSDDFYTYLYQDCLEKEYYQKLSRIRNYMEQLQPDPNNNLTDVSSRLRQLKNNFSFLDTQKINNIDNTISNNYNTWNGQRTGNQGNLPMQLKDYVRRQEKNVKNNPGNYICQGYRNNHTAAQINSAKTQLAQAAGTLYQPIHFPKNDFVNALNTIPCAALDIDSNLFANIITDISNAYDSNGNRQSGYQFTSSLSSHFQKVTDLYEMIDWNICNNNSRTNGLNGSYRKVCQEYLQCESLRSNLNPAPATQSSGGRNNTETYFKKMICIKHYSPDFASNLVLLNCNALNMDKLTILKQIARFYLAFKIIRNNTNHSNGQGDIYVKETCMWLGSASGGNVIDLQTCTTSTNTITLSYETTADLLDKAINFNRALDRSLSSQNMP